jgi:hypothetical protein
MAKIIICIYLLTLNIEPGIIVLLYDVLQYHVIYRA